MGAAGVSAAERKVCGIPAATLIRNFTNIAFGSEHKPSEEECLTKWRRPIRYRVVDHVGVEAPVRADLDGHMGLLGRLTRLSIRHARRGDDPNFLIIFTRLSRFRRTIARHLARRDLALLSRLTRADCIGIMQRRLKTNEIVRAVAIIPVDHARERGLLYHCIVEETTQLMGLPNDSDNADFSIFNDRSKRDDLGCQDRVFVRILYDRSLKVGMSKREALAPAERALRRIAGEDVSKPKK